MSRWSKPGSEVTRGALYMRNWLQTDKGEEHRRRHREYMKEWRKANADKHRATQRRCYDGIRLECFQHYSGLAVPACRCCGETISAFLHLDHKNGDGSVMRRRIHEETGQLLNGGTALYYWLKKHNWPDDLGLQVLCANCNLGKRCGMYCPHELARGVDMDGEAIPERFLKSPVSLMPKRRGAERELWLASPEGIAYRERQAAAKRKKSEGVTLQ